MKLGLKHIEEGGGGRSRLKCFSYLVILTPSALPPPLSTTFGVTRSPSALASTPAATDYEAELKKIEDDAKKRMDDKVKEVRERDLREVRMFRGGDVD